MSIAFVALLLATAQAGEAREVPRGPGDPPVPAVRARPLRPLPSLFSGYDYPIEAASFNVQGSVEFALVIAANGRVRDCRIVRMSLIRVFGPATCEVLRRRARYTPARDTDGRAVEDMDSGRVFWGLPTVRRPIPPPTRPGPG
jgi:protein TonB